MQYIIFMHLFKILLHYFNFLISAVVILIIKSPNFLCAKSITNIEQLKAQVSHLGCKKKKLSVLKH